MESDVEPGGSSGLDFGVIGEDVDRRHELVEQRASFVIGRSVPFGLPLEVFVELHDGFEVRDCKGAVGLRFTVPFERSDREVEEIVAATLGD